MIIFLSLLGSGDPQGRASAPPRSESRLRTAGPSSAGLRRGFADLKHPAGYNYFNIEVFQIKFS